MKITQKYSHLNGEEYLLVHHKQLYKEIQAVISDIDAEQLPKKRSREKTMKGAILYSPKAMNRAFDQRFTERKWGESKYRYYVTTDPRLMQELIVLPFERQAKFLNDKGVKGLVPSFKQTDFVKEQVAVEVQFGKYAFVAYDLFVKHLLFYSGGVINLGIEILPTRNLQSRMSTGVAYFEGEVYNVLRHGRNNPPVPLLILGVEP